MTLGGVVHRQPGKREYDVSASCTQPQEARKSAPGFLDISATTCVGGGTGTTIDVQGRVVPPPLSPIDGGTAVSPNWNTS